MIIYMKKSYKKRSRKRSTKKRARRARRRTKKAGEYSNMHSKHSNWKFIKLKQIRKLH